MLTPKVGQTYSRFIRNDSEWGFERRLVLEVSSIQVLYRVVTDPPSGTYVETEPVQECVSMSVWNEWVKTAEVSY